MNQSRLGDKFYAKLFAKFCKGNKMKEGEKAIEVFNCQHNMVCFLCGNVSKLGKDGLG